MQRDAFLLFHQNLAFSSIEEDRRSEVVAKCCRPVLDLAEKTNTKICIEMTGWTLEQCMFADASYVHKLRDLMQAGLIELVGSGYSQIIAPLVPYRVNLENQRLGRIAYEEMLGATPTAFLVNEMAFSPGSLDAYERAGCQTLFMDRDNMSLAGRFSKKRDLSAYTGLANANGSRVNAVWTDSILFQKFQRVAHGQITFDEYQADFAAFLEKYDGPVPVYCNDAEIFDFRPGRFKEEAKLHPDGEWQRIEKLVGLLKNEHGCVFGHSDALIGQNGQDLILNSLHMPIAVKKQPKYNIGRWAVSGRDDQKMNTKCHALAAALAERPDATDSDWRDLCRLWASDLRTHITEARWKTAQSEIDTMLQRYSPSVPDRFDGLDFKKDAALEEACFAVENETLMLKMDQVELMLDLRKGGAVRRLGFADHGFKEIIGSYPHGHFEDIQLGADFLSGSLLLEVLDNRKRHTDYETVRPDIGFSDEFIRISFDLDIFGVPVEKHYFIGRRRQEVTLQYVSAPFPQAEAILRVGNFLLKNMGGQFPVRVNTGGETDDEFIAFDHFDHTAPVSTFVSSSSGLSAPTGEIRIGEAEFGVSFSWDNRQSYLFPMFVRRAAEPNDFLRLVFSKSEIDDTCRPKSLDVGSCVTITPLGLLDER